MQKSLTVSGKRFTGNQIANMFDSKNLVNCGSYIVYLNGKKFFADYRQIQDQYFAPICSKENANAIALMPDDGYFCYSIWLYLL